MRSTNETRRIHSGQIRRVLHALLALGTLLLSACSGLAQPQPLDLVVLHSNDTFGFTKPAT